MEKNTEIYLRDNFFTEKERLFTEHAGIKVSLFRYDSGVAAIKISNERGNLVILPYKGQQIWSCFFDDRDLKMKSMFKEPARSSDYLSTYGGFYLHCGATAIGVPSKSDTHPLHGELPNAPYQSAYIKCGQNKKGDYIAVGGKYEYTVAFNHHYLAEPLVTIYENSGIIDITMKITNLMKTQMELMYLGHLNFRPVDNSELVYTADYDSDNIVVNINVPDHIKTRVSIETFKAFLTKLKNDPKLHHIMHPEALYDPEVVMSIKYKSDENGIAHSMQIHPDGYADYASHKPSQLPRALRWIARTPDQDAFGMVLPSTSGNDGYLAEHAAGNYIILAPGESTTFDLQAGLLTPDEAQKMKVKIEAI